MLAYLATIPFAVTHLDYARDISYALQIARGQQLPLQGPSLGGIIHLGPIWYYLLALPLLITHSWLATAFFVGLLGSLKYFLAYRAGTLLIDRRFGILWAGALALPGWNNYETVFLSHTTVTATCTLLFIYWLIQLAKTRHQHYLIGLALAYSLALHAHPSTYGLALLALPVILYVWRLDGIRLTSLGLATVLALVPFLPFLVAQADNGFADFIHGLNYFQIGKTLGNPSDLPKLLWGTLFTGPQAVAAYFFNLNASGRLLYTLCSLLIWLLAGVGWVFTIIPKRLANQRKLLQVLVTGIAAALVVGVSVLLIRSETPFYMTYVLLTLLNGLLALGLYIAWTISSLRRMVTAFLVGMAVLTLVTEVAQSKTLAQGEYHFAIKPLFDVKTPMERGEQFMMMPAYAMAASGDYLCRRQPITVHGAYATHLFLITA